jgi:hypothetical protein
MSRLERLLQRGRAQGQTPSVFPNFHTRRPDFQRIVAPYAIHWDRLLGPLPWHTIACCQAAASHNLLHVCINQLNQKSKLMEWARQCILTSPSCLGWDVESRLDHNYFILVARCAGFDLRPFDILQLFVLECIGHDLVPGTFCSDIILSVCAIQLNQTYELMVRVKQRILTWPSSLQPKLNRTIIHRP